MEETHAEKLELRWCFIVRVCAAVCSDCCMLLLVSPVGPRAADLSQVDSKSTCVLYGLLYHEGRQETGYHTHPEELGFWRQFII